MAGGRHSCLSDGLYNESQVTFNDGTDGNTIYIANMVFLRLFAVGLARFGAKLATQITMKF